MKRTLLSTLVITSTLGLSTSVLALGMGELKLQSSLNEPLQAEIQLTNVKGLTEWEIKPSLASEKDFDRAGVEKTFFLSDIDFSVDGKRILLSSNKSVTEPFLNLLVQVNWPTGRVLREYTLLLDPPKTNSSATPLVTSGAYQASPETQSSAKTSGKKSQDLVIKTPKPAVTNKWNTEPAKPGTYKVKRNDTLWKIALRTRPNKSISTEQMMLAIKDANPNAFINGDASRLKSHQVLNIPNEKQILSRTAKQAQNEFSLEETSVNSKVTPKGAQLDATDKANEENNSEPSKQGGELKLLVKEGSQTKTSGASGDIDKVESGAVNSNTQDELAVALESLDTSKLENEDLKKHLASLEEQVATLQRLVSLQNDQLATLQGADYDNEKQVDAQSGEIETDLADESLNAATEGNSDAEKAIEEADSVDDESVLNSDLTADNEDSLNDEFDLEKEAAAAIANFTDIDSEEESIGDINDTVDSNSSSEVDDLTTADTEQLDYNFAETDQSESGQEDIGDTNTVNSTTNIITNTNTSIADKRNQPQGFMANVMAKPEMYGGIIAGIVLLLALLLLALKRRRENEEEPEEIEDISLSEIPLDEIEEEIDEQPEEVSESADILDQSDDVLGEAEIYIAYGRYEQAIKLLEGGIEQEPGRTDLHLKLLEVYAETDNAEGFSKTESSLNELYDRDADDKALVLKNRLTSPIAAGAAIVGAGTLLAEDDENEVPLLDVEDLAESDEDFVDDLDFEAALDLSEEADNDDSDSLMHDLDLASESDLDSDLKSEKDSELDLESDFDLSSEFELDLENESSSDNEGFDDLLALSATDEAETAALDLHSESEDSVDREDLSVLEEEFDLDGLDSLDESDEKSDIKSELELAAEPTEASGLEVENKGEGEDDNIKESADIELDSEEFSPLSDDELASLSESDDDLNDEFDFLAGADECATKLDLARAYMDMEDADGAKDLLNEVLASGSEEQKQEAQSILDDMK